MIDTASLFKQRRRSLVAAPGAAPPRLASAALRWPRGGRGASPPPVRALAERAPGRWAGRVTAGGARLPANLLRLASEKLKIRQTSSPNGRGAGEGPVQRGRRGGGFWSRRCAGRRAAAPEPRPPAPSPGKLGSSRVAGSWLCASPAILFSPHSPSGGWGRGRAAGGRRRTVGARPPAELSPGVPAARTAGEAGSPSAWVTYLGGGEQWLAHP